MNEKQIRCKKHVASHLITTVLLSFQKCFLLSQVYSRFVSCLQMIKHLPDSSTKQTGHIYKQCSGSVEMHTMLKYNTMCTAQGDHNSVCVREWAGQQEADVRTK